jgi:hypothetical protein
MEAEESKQEEGFINIDDDFLARLPNNSEQHGDLSDFTRVNPICATTDFANGA